MGRVVILIGFLAFAFVSCHPWTDATPAATNAPMATEGEPLPLPATLTLTLQVSPLAAPTQTLEELRAATQPPVIMLIQSPTITPTVWVTDWITPTLISMTEIPPTLTRTPLPTELEKRQRDDDEGEPYCKCGGGHTP